MENISFDLYRLFYVVANSKTISEASAKLYITQPAVTQGIKKLESQIGGNLFYRTTKGISLTEEGKRLYKYIESSIQTLDNTQKTFDKYINLEEGKIKIKSGNIEEKYDVYENISRFMKDYQNIDIQIFDGISRLSIEELVTGETDMVILNLPYQYKVDEKVELKEIESKQLCLYCTEEYYKNHINKKKSLSIKDFNSSDFIFAPAASNTGRIISNFLEENGLNTFSRFNSPSVAERRFFAEQSLGVLIALEEKSYEKSLIKLEIKEELPKISVGIATLKDDVVGFATKKLKRYILGEE